MRIHLPRPPDGWDTYLTELSIVVLGVLIALGAQQAVETWHWHQEAKTIRKALSNEIEYSALWAEERIAVQQCLRDRIAHLIAKLNGGSPTWTADPALLGQPRNPIGRSIETGIQLVYRAPHRPWLRDEWETAKSSGAIDHLDRDDSRNLEFIYRNINQLGLLQEEEASLQPQASFLSFNQILEPQSRVQAFVTLSRLDYLNAMQAQSALQLLSTLQSSHLALGPISIGQHPMSLDAARKRMMTALRERYGNCVTAPPPP